MYPDFGHEACISARKPDEAIVPTIILVTLINFVSFLGMCALFTRIFFFFGSHVIGIHVAPLISPFNLKSLEFSSIRFTISTSSKKRDLQFQPHQKIIIN